MSTYNLRKRPNKATSALAANARATRAVNTGESSVNIGRSDQNPGHDEDVHAPEENLSRGASLATHSALNENPPSVLSPPPHVQEDIEESHVNHSVDNINTGISMSTAPTIHLSSNNTHNLVTTLIRTPDRRTRFEEVDEENDSGQHIGNSLYFTAPNTSYNRVIDEDQEADIDLATMNMTQGEQELVNRRNEILGNGTSRNGQEETYNKDKGKATDPRNWGAVGIPEREMRSKTQAKVWKEIKHQQEKAESKGKEKYSRTTHRSASTPISTEFENKIRKVAGSRRDIPRHKKKDTRKTSSHKQSNHEQTLLPSNQIDPKSFLGRAFKYARFEGPVRGRRSAYMRSNRKVNLESSSDDLGSGESGPSHTTKDSLSTGSDNSNLGSGTSDPSSGSDSEDSGSVSPPSDHPSDEDSEGSPSSTNSSQGSVSSQGSSGPSSNTSGSSRHSGHHCRHGHHHRQRRRQARRKHKRSLLKPIPPEKYDGKADAQIFHRFMTQSTDYVKDGRVPRDRSVSVISNFLTEKAYTFYTREVAMQSKRWTLDKFFTELFNYCFPTNFRAIQRQRLENCYQGSMSVKEYVYKLNELFTTVGYTDRRSHVHKLWDGFHPELQRELWKDKLNPESSSYKSIVKAAELNEIADSIVRNSKETHHSPRDHKGRKDNRRNSHSHHSSNNDRKEYQNRDHGNQYKQNRNHEHRSRNFRKKTNGIPSLSNQWNQTSNHNSLRQENNGNRPSTNQQRKRSNRQQLSPEELNRCHAEDQCFECGETGHMSHQCPKRNRIASSSGNKPPGVHALNIDIGTIQQVKDLRELAETTENMDTGDLQCWTEPFTEFAT